MQRLKRLEQVHHMACRLRNEGHKNREVAEKVSRKYETVRRWFADPLIKAECERLRLASEKAMMRREAAGGGAAAVVRDVIEDHAELLAKRLVGMLADGHWQKLGQTAQLNVIKEMFRAMGIGEAAGGNQVVIQITAERVNSAHQVLSKVTEADFVEVK